MLLTATPPGNEPKAAIASTILGILKADGFKTAWLANNEAGPHARERGHDLYAGVFNVNPDAADGARGTRPSRIAAGRLRLYLNFSLQSRSLKQTSPGFS
jgi:hypothetical protein